ncbi:hypothetical protein IEQ11_04895 [Lysobacter capsici]|uniref:hypothetical protein n=1 Tax=Lysobacter capsici TaxID=435897 RepID=UPI001785B22A|nr:hypothetical protein [Lysobacter capsici]UOF15998.1 hypothetical protein IEQ11_04895 [Lysobacter capsici]
MAESLRLLERLRSFLSSFPRTRESSEFGEALSSRHSREGGNPETSNVLARKALDSRLRGNDEQEQKPEQQQQQQQQKQQAAPVYIAAKRGEPKRRNGAGDGR